MMMSEATLEPLTVPEIYCDGLTDIKIVNGMFRCVFYTLKEVNGRTFKVAVLRMVVPASEVPGAACAAFNAVTKNNLVSLFGRTPPLGC